MRGAGVGPLSIGPKYASAITATRPIGVTHLRQPGCGGYSGGLRGDLRPGSRCVLIPRPWTGHIVLDCAVTVGAL